MSDFRIASRYAKALFDKALEINYDNKNTVNYLFECLYSLKNKKKCSEIIPVVIPSYIY